MKIALASVHASGKASNASSGKAGRIRSKSAHTDALVDEYGSRIAHFADWEALRFGSEAALLEWAARQQGRIPLHLILLDSRGKQHTSEQFAAQLGALRDRGVQQIVFAIGPADGWSGSAREKASQVVSLGLMTLPHELARAVVAEQIYRALTILAGHPYHSGHE